MSNIGTPQYIQFLSFKDCLEKSKKKNKDKFKNSEDLIWNVLCNSSIVDHGAERSFSSVCNAINVLNKFLCPSVWCSRSHCKHYSSRNAYNCGKNTRPSVCQDFFNYVEKKLIKEKNLLKDDIAKDKLNSLIGLKSIDKNNVCSGYFFDDARKTFIVFLFALERTLLSEYKRSFDALIAIYYEQEKGINRDIVSYLNEENR
jgi:hypothetical protein